MSIAQTCNRNVIFIDANANISEVAEMMREKHVGSIIVVDQAGKPIGIITDRDLVIEILAKEVPPDSVILKDIMTTDPVVIKESEDISDALDKMRHKAVRRAPVVDDEGLLSGIISVDDILTELGAEINDIIALINQSRIKETKRRS